MKIAVLGDGGMGTACALVLASKPGQEASLFSVREENGKLLQQKRENIKYLPGVAIPESIHLTTRIEEAIEKADWWVIAIPTVYLRKSLIPLQKELRANPAPFVSVAKGLELDTFLRPTQIVQEIAGNRVAAMLSGPGHAEEIVRGQPTSLVVASEKEAFADQVQEAFHGTTLRVYTNTDLIGVEIAGALKNVIGIAAGISDGLGFGDNAKSALLTRALVEMIEFGKAMGAKPSTFFGLAGIGDLITTSVSQHGRNRRLGERIGKGESLQDILATTTQVAEGVYTAQSVHAEANRLGIKMPICHSVYRILYENHPPRQAVMELMQRDRKSEVIWSSDVK